MSPDVEPNITCPSGSAPGAPAALPAGYGAALVVDLGALRQNYRRLCAETAAGTGGTEVAATVKASAYGLGIADIAPQLAAAGAAKFFVATAQEGHALREILPHATIYVLNGYDTANRRLFTDDALTPVLNSLAELTDWRQDMPPTAPALLHCDTGMNRLGMSQAEVSQLAGRPELINNHRIDYIISHLACADTPASPMNARQLQMFGNVRQSLQPAFSSSPTTPGASLAGSSGIFLGHDYHFDLTRPGAALYGLAPQEGSANPMQPVVYLFAKILRLRDVDSPMTVGYGAAHKVRGSRKIATISVGYADGYPRSAGQGATVGGAPSNQPPPANGQAWIAGTTVPIVGRISMDLITLDVTDMPDEHRQPGAQVELIGAHISADDVAAAAGTIGYEILTSLGSRAHRIYINPGVAGDDRPVASRGTPL